MRRQQQHALWERLALVLFLCLILGPISLARVNAAEATREPRLTVWLIPQEVAAFGSNAEDWRQAEDSLGGFRERYGPESRVRLLNLEPPLSDNLLWSGLQLSEPNLALLLGQRRTLERLDSWARTRGISLNVRFLTWDRALEQIRLEASRPRSLAGSSIHPDVIQVGNTWVADLFADHLIESVSSHPSPGWRALPRAPALSLPYTRDVHLLYWWWRPATGPAEYAWAELKGGSWPDLLASLSTSDSTLGQERPPFVQPIGRSLMLLYDYLSLVHVGGGQFLYRGGKHADLCSERAMRGPLLVSQIGERGTSARRSISFPEISHEEAAQAFLAGKYGAIIEPSYFMARWCNSFVRRNGGSADFRSAVDSTPSGMRFSDYAGVAAAPSPFLGGSELVVARGAPIEDARDLAAYLARDAGSIDELFEIGQLPAQITASELGERLANAEGPIADSIARRQFAQAVVKAIESSWGPPATKDWSDNIENDEFLDMLHRVWRRIADGSSSPYGPQDLRVAVSAAEGSLNRQIDPLYPITIWMKAALPWVAPVVALGLALLVLDLRKRKKVLEQANRVRSFAAASIMLLDAVHRRSQHTRGSTPAQAKNADMIVAGLDGIRRGSAEAEWRPRRLQDIVSTSLLLAIDADLGLGVFQDWEQSGRPAVIGFLERQGLLRGAGPGRYDFHLDVTGAPEVTEPLLMEQMLAGLLHNAIRASTRDDETVGRIEVLYDTPAGEVTITSDGPEFPSDLRDSLNRADTIQELDRRIRQLLAGPEESRPGIELVQAACIALRCYGGLRVESRDTHTVVALRLSTNRRRSGS